MFIPTYELHFKKNMELLRSMPDNSLDAGVMDCPYGLGKEPDAVETLKAWITTGYHEISGAGFMGKKWDSFVPQPIFWKEVYRVLKPGGYVLAFFGTRTYDWGTMAIRLAGFEIRDCIQWIYGSGFPKSHDVSKAIDKDAGVERQTIGISNRHGGGIKGNGSSYELPAERHHLTAPGSEDAETWNGYGTALKPANEPICVARKPLAGTVANNVLTYGCGALNLNGCRINVDENERNIRDSANHVRKTGSIWGEADGAVKEFNEFGRFPANVIFDEEAAAVLDQQTGILKSGGSKPLVETPKQNQIFGKYAKANINSFEPSEGGASRFFYCAKSSKEDRNYGCEGLEMKDPACVTDFRPSLKDSPESWTNGTENAYMRTTQKKNNHPTVKPIELMRYLCRLVKTPLESCTIADFFMGSGTTGVACMLEGINFIGCDEDENSYNLSTARVSFAQKDYIKQQSQPKQSQLFEPEKKKSPVSIAQTLF